MPFWVLVTDTGHHFDITAWPTPAEAQAHLRALYEVPDTVTDIDLMQHVADNYVTYLTEVPLRIEVLHERAPDSSCNLRLFIDGVEHTDFDTYDIDPGAGGSRSGWAEYTEDVVAKASPGLAPILRDACDLAADSDYLSEEDYL